MSTRRVTVVLLKSVMYMQAEFAADANFVYSERITMKQSIALLRVPTNMYVFIQGLFGCLPWGVLLTYLTDYLAQDKGLSVPTATMVSIDSLHSFSLLLLLLLLLVLCSSFIYVQLLSPFCLNFWQASLQLQGHFHAVVTGITQYLHTS